MFNVTRTCKSGSRVEIAPDKPIFLALSTDWVIQAEFLTVGDTRGSPVHQRLDFLPKVTIAVLGG